MCDQPGHWPPLAGLPAPPATELPSPGRQRQPAGWPAPSTVSYAKNLVELALLLLALPYVVIRLIRNPAAASKAAARKAGG